MIKLIHGDCLEEMKKMKESSVDTIITDPPYGLNFMGKDWDKFGKGLNPAGGNTGRNTPYARNRVAPAFYHYGNKEMVAYQESSYMWAKETFRIAKHGATLLCFGGTRTYHRLACAIEDAGWILKDCIMWLYGSGFPKATDISKQLDKGHKRKIIGEGNKPWGKTDANQHKWGMKQESYITEPTTSQGKLWNGWKSHGLKPAYEPILVAMKPNEGSYAENALKHGVAGLNIDGGRIGTETIKGQKCGNAVNTSFMSGGFTPEHQGRFPANIILDQEAAEMLDEQSGELTSGKMNSVAKGNQYNTYGKMYERKVTNPASKGGASRFFYVAKASKSERNMGCGGLEEKKRWLKGGGGTGISARENIVSKNNHPTVKPLKLMEYLCRLTKTPTGGIVLDPFMGSGTTGMACKLTGRDFIGIEKEEEYIKIAEARIKATMENLF